MVLKQMDVGQHLFHSKVQLVLPVLQEQLELRVFQLLVKKLARSVHKDQLALLVLQAPPGRKEFQAPQEYLVVQVQVAQGLQARQVHKVKSVQQVLLVPQDLKVCKG
jgi:hypothetical protein